MFPWYELVHWCSNVGFKWSKETSWGSRLRLLNFLPDVPVCWTPWGSSWWTSSDRSWMFGANSQVIQSVQCVQCNESSKKLFKTEQDKGTEEQGWRKFLGRFESLSWLGLSLRCYWRHWRWKRKASCQISSDVSMTSRRHSEAWDHLEEAACGLLDEDSSMKWEDSVGQLLVECCVWAVGLLRSLLSRASTQSVWWLNAQRRSSRQEQSRARSMQGGQTFWHFMASVESLRCPG
jgi:hypothetical protein